VYWAHGDLYLVGGGDPTLRVAGLRALARQLRAHGIRRVQDVLADESAFDTRRTAPGWKAEFYRHESPPLSALVVARGTFHREISPDPAGAAAALFVNQLRRSGVHVGGQSAWGKTPAGARLVARVRSAPLADVVQFMDRWSDNFTAEMLLKTLGHGTTARGAHVVVRTLRAAHVPLRGVRIADGSGLSSLDRFTARALGGILLAGWRDLRIRPYLWRALAVSGRTGTLADRLYGVKGLVHAKTGTTDIASALSGFATRRYAFVVVQDGDPINTWSARAAQDRFATVLATAGRCRATCR
jgi:D-alanyl-D-alanine carboxypeptidase/D-alanyl-D-alanine-endopeptidase (penicillin-binding protein 4)